MASDLAIIVWLLFTLFMLGVAAVAIIWVPPQDAGVRLALTATMIVIPATLLVVRVWSLTMLSRRGVEMIAEAIGRPYPSPGNSTGWIQEYSYEWQGRPYTHEVKAFFAASTLRFGKRAVILVDPKRPQRSLTIADATRPARKPIRWRGLQPRAVLFGVLTPLALYILYFGAVVNVIGAYSLIPRPIDVTVGMVLSFFGGYVAAAIAGDRPLAHASAVVVCFFGFEVLAWLTGGTGPEPLDVAFFSVTVAGGFFAALRDRSAIARDRRGGIPTATG